MKCWYLSLVNKIKLAKITHGTWQTNLATTNATSGQQGAKQPAPSSNDSAKTPVPMDPNVPDFLYKTNDITYPEVKLLLERYSCPICMRNNHALHTCGALKRVYNISLHNQPPLNTSNSSAPTPAASATQTTHPIIANRVLTSVSVLPDEADRYDGFKSIVRPPPDSDTDESTPDANVTAIEDSLRLSKINENSNPYSTSTFIYKHNVGSACRLNIALPYNACFCLSSTTNSEYPIIIDSGAAHHMWNSSAFINFKYLHIIVMLRWRTNLRYRLKAKRPSN